jgi:hypothetical protein
MKRFFEPISKAVTDSGLKVRRASIAWPELKPPERKPVETEAYSSWLLLSR